MFEDGTGEMKVHRGKTHKYLGMSLDFGRDNQCRITMIDYVARMTRHWMNLMMVSVLSRRRVIQQGQVPIHHLSSQ